MSMPFPELLALLLDVACLAFSPGPSPKFINVARCKVGEPCMGNHVHGAIIDIPVYANAISTLRDSCRSLPCVCLMLTVDARKEIRLRVLEFSN